MLAGPSGQKREGEKSLGCQSHQEVRQSCQILSVSFCFYMYMFRISRIYFN